jgi:hypothetical protein
MDFTLTFITYAEASQDDEEEEIKGEGEEALKCRRQTG